MDCKACKVGRERKEMMNFAKQHKTRNYEKDPFYFLFFFMESFCLLSRKSVFFTGGFQSDIICRYAGGC